MGDRGLVVAIDGPVGSGKTTVARRVASRLGFGLVDTGAIYRSLALQAREQGVDWQDERGLERLASALEVEFEPDGAGGQRVLLQGRDVSREIRLPEISQGASQVSAHPKVRQALLHLQRRLAEAGAVVMEGRDIGTVVWPQAQVKVFLGASDEVRARRRYEELRAKGLEVDFADTLEQLRERDRRDSQRQVAPLRPAEDAVLVDTTEMSLEQVVNRVLELVDGARGSS